MKEVSLQVLSSPGCTHCAAFEDFWHSIEKDWPNVKHEGISILDTKGQELAQKHMIFSSPGIFLNEELIFTGGHDKEKFLAKLKELSGA
ncbi:MAG: thioredoxin family protein [Patescibacteria group bacterium]